MHTPHRHLQQLLPPFVRFFLSVSAGGPLVAWPGLDPTGRLHKASSHSWFDALVRRIRAFQVWWFRLLLGHQGQSCCKRLNEAGRWGPVFLFAFFFGHPSMVPDIKILLKTVVSNPGWFYLQGTFDNIWGHLGWSLLERRGMLLASGGWKLRDTVQHLMVYRTPHPREWSGPKSPRMNRVVSGRCYKGCCW